MKKAFKICVSIFLLLVIFSYKEKGAQPTKKALASPFRVIAYLQADALESYKEAKFDFGTITHLNIAFINPDCSGNFPEVPGLDEMIDAAHKHHVKVMASTGGGPAPAYYCDLMSDDRRNELIKKMVQYTVDKKFDGIDVDLEEENIDNNYEAFVTGLSEALKPTGKMLTAAVATVYGSNYPDKALACMDFLNIMSYDKTGPWQPETAGQHAPYEMAIEDLDYWANTRGIAKDKLNLGMPFYGYGFGPNAPTALSFKEIINKYPGSELNDQVAVSERDTIYYNGIPTIQNKTRLALQYAGGVMVWQLMQDADGNNSLLRNIYTTIQSAGFNVVQPFVLNNVKYSPSPISF
ncbi:MAG: glycosyl hydrolase family 18 protein [Bacteroidota bacterium]|nr:glycosyl hydrolase family 18 protein [Bacteroidota bacterium]